MADRGGGQWHHAKRGFRLRSNRRPCFDSAHGAIRALVRRNLAPALHSGVITNTRCFRAEEAFGMINAAHCSRRRRPRGASSPTIFISYFASRIFSKRGAEAIGNAHQAAMASNGERPIRQSAPAVTARFSASQMKSLKEKSSCQLIEIMPHPRRVSPGKSDLCMKE